MSRNVKKVVIDWKDVKESDYIIGDEEKAYEKAANYIISYLNDNGPDEDYGDKEAVDLKNEIIENIVNSVPFPYKVIT